MRKYNVEEFAELMNIKTSYDINDINELLLAIEEKGANIWSYAPEDADEIKDFSMKVFALFLFPPPSLRVSRDHLPSLYLGFQSIPKTGLKVRKWCATTGFKCHCTRLRRPWENTKVSDGSPHFLKHRKALRL
jgi:hypothetical protein